MDVLLVENSAQLRNRFLDLPADSGQFAGLSYAAGRMTHQARRVIGTL